MPEEHRVTTTILAALTAATQAGYTAGRFAAADPNVTASDVAAAQAASGEAQVAFWRLYQGTVR